MSARTNFAHGAEATLRERARVLSGCRCIRAAVKGAPAAHSARCATTQHNPVPLGRPRWFSIVRQTVTMRGRAARRAGGRDLLKAEVRASPSGALLLSGDATVKADLSSRPGRIRVRDASARCTAKCVADG